MFRFMRLLWSMAAGVLAIDTERNLATPIAASDINISNEIQDASNSTLQDLTLDPIHNPRLIADVNPCHFRSHTDAPCHHIPWKRRFWRH
jgi:hypothetical protein